MSVGSSLAEKQLELFDVTKSPRPQPRRQTPGWVIVPLRHDQVILAAIAGLIGLTVVFATGVERGKQLVRAEGASSFDSLRSLRTTPSQGPSANTGARVEGSWVRSPVDAPGGAKRVTTPSRDRESQNAARPDAVRPASAPLKLPTEVSPKNTPKGTAPVKVASAPPASSAGSASRYAVQVVTYRTPQLAKRELNRLHASGEPGFLVMRNGYTVVYAGPFPSKAHAREKVTELKRRYGDCFIKTL